MKRLFSVELPKQKKSDRCSNKKEIGLESGPMTLLWSGGRLSVQSGKQHVPFWIIPSWPKRRDRKKKKFCGKVGSETCWAAASNLCNLPPAPPPPPFCWFPVGYWSDHFWASLPTKTTKNKKLLFINASWLNKSIQLASVKFPRLSGSAGGVSRNSNWASRIRVLAGQNYYYLVF